MSYLGADPEVPIFDANGRAIPAHRRGFPHKSAKLAINHLGSVIRDGWNIELNPTVATCREILSNEVGGLLYACHRALKKGEHLKFVPYYEINLSDLDTAPDDVALLGCDKSWNAYTGAESSPSPETARLPARMAGGHQHISTSTKAQWHDDPHSTFLLIKLFDRFIGLISTYVAGSELAGERRKYYGQAGEFRFQNYGAGYYGSVEYRVPGPEIFATTPRISFFYGLLRYIHRYFPQFSQVYSPKHEGQVRDAINRGVSDPSLLDLIPELPYYYTKPLLQEFRKRVQKKGPIVFSPINWRHGNEGWDTYRMQHMKDLNQSEISSARNAEATGRYGNISMYGKY